MIASLSGRLKRNAPDYLIVEVGGVGYRVQSPLSTISALPGIGEDVALHIYTYIREDTLSLYGFFTEQEKDMFLILLGVSGIGPRLALAILSCLSVQDIVSALRSSDDARLCAIPGIGKKTAARMILELKDKVKTLSTLSLPQEQPAPASVTAEDAVAALVSLGYKQALAEEAVGKVLQNRTDLNVQTVIREALGVLMKK